MVERGTRCEGEFVVACLSPTWRARVLLVSCPPGTVDSVAVPGASCLFLVAAVFVRTAGMGPGPNAQHQSDQCECDLLHLVLLTQKRARPSLSEHQTWPLGVCP